MDFFERPLSRKPGYVAAHRGLRNLHPTLVLKSLAVLGEGQIGVGLLRWPGSHSLKALPFTEGLPGILWMFTSPVRRLRPSQRLMVERETPKSSATSFLGIPRSMAARDFNLRSFENALMESILMQVRYLRNPLSQPLPAHEASALLEASNGT